MIFSIFEKLGDLLSGFDKQVSHHSQSGYTYGIEVTLSEPSIFKQLDDESAAVLRNRLLSYPATAHLPFYDLKVGSHDRHIEEYSIETIKAGIDISAKLGITRVVAHTGWIPLVPRITAKKIMSGFLANKTILENYASSKDILISWENVWEKDFCFFDELLSEQPNTRLCLDTGHANCFSGFTPLQFIERYGKSIFHVHLHDNKGDEDSHMPIGRGNIDFLAIAENLEKTNAGTAVFELDKKDFIESIENINNIFNRFFK